MKTKRISILLRTAFVLLFTVSAFSGTWAAEAYIDENGESKTLDATVLTASTATPLAAGWYIVKGNVTFNKMINCTGDINLILADGAHLTINNSSECLYVQDSLNIYRQSGGTGILTVASTGNHGIYAKVNVNIYGGNIHATGGSSDGSGIYAGSSVTIAGGTVNTTGNKGIDSNGSVTITGGIVSAYGTSYVGINANSFSTTAGTVTGLVRDNGNKKITLYGRTFIKDGNWNTLCLPFNATTAQLGSGVTVKELDATNTSLDDSGKLTLTFTNAYSIEACKPYLVKWPSGTNVANPYFTGDSGAPSISDARLQEITVSHQ